MSPKKPERVNLEDQYKKIVGIVTEYRQWMNRSAFRMLWPRNLVRFYYIMFRDMMRSKRMQPPQKRLAPLLFSDKEKKDPLYRAMIARSPIHRLSGHIEKTFPHFAYEQLAKMQEIVHARLNFLQPGRLVGIVLAGTTLLLKTVPRSVIESFGWDYASFEINAFWAAVGALGYIGFLGYFISKEIAICHLAKEVIDYVAAQQKAAST